MKSMNLSLTIAIVMLGLSQALAAKQTELKNNSNKMVRVTYTLVCDNQPDSMAMFDNLAPHTSQSINLNDQCNINITNIEAQDGTSMGADRTGNTITISGI